MRPRAIVLAIGMLVLTACDATMPLRDIPLEWKPTSTVSPGPPMTTQARIEFRTFKDVSEHPQLIAENREDPATPKQVTTRDNVGSFVTTHLRQLFEQAGLATVDQGGDVIVTGEVRQFFVAETATYEGTVVLHLSFSDRDGKVLWSGSPTGTARRFGRSYSQENYYEVLADSLVNACSSLLRDRDVRAAIAHH